MRIVLLIVLAFTLTLAGCSGPTGPTRFSISGAITMPDGKPVPAGEVNFEPDGSAGNKGPASMTQIKAGKYSLPQDQGVLGGAYIVTITPFDGVEFGESLQGKPLLQDPYVEKVEFPPKNSTKDFAVTMPTKGKR